MAVLAELWGKFHKMDRNDESRLSRKEFVDGQRIFGFGLSRERATELFKELDADDSGSVRFEEFVQWIIVRMKEQGKRVAPVAPPAEHIDGADGEPSSAFNRFYNERRLRELQRIRAGGELANGTTRPRPAAAEDCQHNQLGCLAPASIGQRPSAEPDVAVEQQARQPPAVSWRARPRRAAQW